MVGASQLNMLLGQTPMILGASDLPLTPVWVIILCALAGFGTFFLLPSRRERNSRRVGGAILMLAGAIFALILINWSVHQSAGGQAYWYFWIFSALALWGSVRVITHPKPVYAALYFVLTVFASAGLFLLMWAEFMAAALVLIYAGAILVTYVFVIMLAAEASHAGTGQSGASDGLTEHDAISREPFTVSVLGFVLMGLILFVVFNKYESIARLPVAPAAGIQGHSQQLGVFLFDRHLVSFELAGLILTVSMVGAIMIARRRGLDSVEEQLSGESMTAPATPVDDNPHSIPVYGTENPKQKQYPEA
jgi:NADH-quinone oxidoreductase subunit J